MLLCLNRIIYWFLNFKNEPLLICLNCFSRRKNLWENKNHIFKIKSYHIFFSLKDTPATGETPGPQKRTSSTSNYSFTSLFFVGHFCSPCSGSGSSQPKSMRTHLDPDPDSQHYYLGLRIAFFLYLSTAFLILS